MALYLTEADVGELLSMPLALEAVEEAFAAKARGEAVNLPRRRVTLGEGAYNIMAAGWPSKGVAGHKAYIAARGRAQFHVSLYSTRGEGLLAIVEASRLGQVRTGAASGLATRLMACAGPLAVGVIGSGFQAETQLEAIAAACDVASARVYSRSAERRESFAARMSERLGIDVRPAESGEACVEGADVAVAISNSREPVIIGDWLRPGMHVNAAGNNSWLKRELDTAAIVRCDLIATDDVEQAKTECGELMRAVEVGRLSWERVIPFEQIVGGLTPGRGSSEDITLFESQGVALEDVAVAERLYRLAVEQGVGTRLPE